MAAWWWWRRWRRRPSTTPLFLFLSYYHFLNYAIWSSLIITIATTTYLMKPVSADCECGYAVDVNFGLSSSSSSSSPSPTGRRQFLFTELTESNFSRMKKKKDNNNDDEESIGENTDWVRQEFEVSAEDGRGRYGLAFDVERIQLVSSSSYSSPPPSEEEESSSSSSSSSGSQQRELALTVRGGGELTQGMMVPSAEIDTSRMDMTFGTFRVLMKLPDVAGTCAAFFWYFNDTQEIDMEFLSKDYDHRNASYPINLVLQSRESETAGYDASRTGTSNFRREYLPFDPTADYHEYRIDYVPGKVVFYADGAMLAEMDGPAVPASSSPGHLALRHWSNGNELWTGGPSSRDAVLLVRWVKAYFNSSSERRIEDWNRRCVGGGGGDPASSLSSPGAVCDVPSVTPEDRGPLSWFFTEQHNMTNNQTWYSAPSDAGAGRRQQNPGQLLLMMTMMMACTCCSWMML